MRNKVTLVYKDVTDKIAEETIWTERLENGYHKVDNIPFFAPNLAYKDIISVENDDGELYFDNLIQASGHSTVQVIFFDQQNEKDVLNRLEESGCQWEGMKGGRYYALDIPPEKNYINIKKILDTERQNSVLDFKEACIAK